MAIPPLPVLEVTSLAAGFDRQRLGEVYATALLGALRRSSEDVPASLRQFGELVTQVLARVPQFQAVMASPRVSNDEKVAVIRRALQGRAADALVRFFEVVGRHGRLDCLREIYRAARRQWNTSQGITQVQVTTAQPLETDLMGRIQQTLSKKLGGDVELDVRVVPQVVGGIRVRIGDEVFDGTVASRLHLMGREAVERAVRAMRGQTEQFVGD